MTVADIPEVERLLSLHLSFLRFLSAHRRFHAATADIPNLTRLRSCPEAAVRAHARRSEFQSSTSLSRPHHGLILTPDDRDSPRISVRLRATSIPDRCRLGSSRQAFRNRNSSVSTRRPKAVSKESRELPRAPSERSSVASRRRQRPTSPAVIGDLSWHRFIPARW